MIGRVPLAFLAGFASFVAPCVLPLVPGYLSTLGAKESPRRALPFVGGLIVHWLHWRVFFLMNLPLSLVGFVLAWRWMPDFRGPEGSRLDLLGFLLLGSGIGLLSYVLEVFGEHRLSPAELRTLLQLAPVRPRYTSGNGNRRATALPEVRRAPWRAELGEEPARRWVDVHLPAVVSR